MKKLLLFALFIGTGTLLVSSCDKEEVTPEVITTNFTLKDFTDVDSLGYYHNGIVRAAVDAGSETAEKIRQHVVSTYNLDPSFDYTIEELVDYTYSLTDSINKYDGIIAYADVSIDQYEAYYLEEVFNALDSMAELGLNYSVFKQQVEALEFALAADENLNEQQRKNLYGTLSVAKASTLLWAPRALGGEGLYEDIHGQGFNKSAGWDWDKATKADIGTSAGFWLTNSVLITIGMTNVATGTGILTAWAISTAVGSLLGGAAAGTPTGG